MSIESARTFIERIKSDEEFRKEFSVLSGGEARRSFIVQAGFDFTIDDLNQVTGELDEDDLGRIAGGHSCSSDCMGLDMNQCDSRGCGKQTVACQNQCGTVCDGQCESVTSHHSCGWHW